MKKKPNCVIFYQTKPNITHTHSLSLKQSFSFTFSHLETPSNNKITLSFLHLLERETHNLQREKISSKFHNSLFNHHENFAFLGLIRRRFHNPRDFVSYPSFCFFQNPRKRISCSSIQLCPNLQIHRIISTFRCLFSLFFNCLFLHIFTKPQNCTNLGKFHENG